MKGYKYLFQGKEIDMSPCFFCKHRQKMTFETPCYDCISNMDLALHKPNSETHFVSFIPLTKEHLKVLEIEQKGVLCK